MRGILVLTLLAACKGGAIPLDTDDTDLVADTDDTDTGPATTGTEALFDAAHAPPLWFRTVSGWVQTTPACPQVSPTDDTHWAVVGGCNDGDVRYEGEIEWLDGPQGRRVGFEGFSVTDADGTAVYDGEIVIFNTGESQANYAVHDGDGELTLSYDGLETAPLEGMLDVWNGQNGSFATVGSLTAVGFGTFVVSETVEHGGACDREPDQGTLSLTGPAHIEFTYNGGAICDGCLPLQVDDENPSEVCPW